MPRRSVRWLLAGVAITALAVFVALTVAVTSDPWLARDSRAFQIANGLRAPWLDAAARLVTKLGLIVIVGSAVLLGAALLIKRRRRARAAALVIGAARISAWIVKSAVAHPRPPDPLAHTGHSYPSAHAANSVGWLALAVALTIVIPTTRHRITAITAGALLAALVGLSRIYLRAHYASDVLAGEALVLAMYTLATIGGIVWQAHRAPAIDTQSLAPPRSDGRRSEPPLQYRRPTSHDLQRRSPLLPHDTLRLDRRRRWGLARLLVVDGAPLAPQVRGKRGHGGRYCW